MRRIRKYIACALSAAMVMSSAFAQGAVVSHAEEQDVGIVATVGDAEEADGVQAEDVEVDAGIEVEAELETEELDAQGDTLKTSEGLEYEVTDDGEITITGYSGTATEVNIPSEIGGKSVTSIGDEAFAGCHSLTSIVISDSVSSIGYDAFSYCDALTSIIVEEGNTVYNSGDGSNALIETSGNKLIKGCKNTVIPKGVTSIGDGAFEGCSDLTGITIPDSVTSIGVGAFYDAGLTSIIIPTSVTDIGVAAFYNCSNLTSITIPGSVTSIGENAFWDCINLTSITIPGSVTSIGSCAFWGCSSLGSVTISDGVTSIGSCAFRLTGLTSITIPTSVTSIGDGAFSRCSSLASITVENGNEVYDSRNGCNAIIETSSNKLITGCQNTVIPKDVISIDDDAFEGSSSLTSIIIPDGVTSIGTYAFGYCSGLTSIIIPNSVTSIGYYSSDYSSIPSNNAFYECSNLTITCAKDSYAYTYATQNNISVNIVASESEKLVISVTDIKLNETIKTLVKGKTVTLKATVTPSNATNTGVTWKSSDTSVATVSTSGVVTAKKGGTATITCTAADGSGVTASCTITVTQPVKSVKLDAKTKTIAKGKSVTLKATVSPSDATDKAVTWKSSNTKVASVSSNGKVTAKKVGTATITCTTKDGKKTYTCKITVKTPVTKVKLSKTKATLKKGKSVKLKATVTPSKAYQKVTWKSSNTKVATVSSSGKVTAKKKGTATITCTAADGSGKKVTCKITVK